MTTVLTMTTLITNTNSELPKISHLTALDAYLFFCFFLVFLSLIEYATVGYYDMVKETDPKIESEKNNKKKDKPHRANSIDYFSRKLFPAVFGVFNVVYALAMIAIVIRNKQVEIEVKV